MSSKFSYYWFLIIPLVFVSWFFISEKRNKPTRYLAYFGPKKARITNDTAYHTIPAFEFIDQHKQKVTQETVKNKIYVSDFFFTSCRSICPIMNSNLEKIYKAFKEREDFMILSHTVDPETDSVSVLKNYAETRGVKDNKWLFLTGDKPQLYELARKGYLLNSEEGNGGEEDFIHTQNFALIDKEQRIRGFYDGTDSTEVTMLMQDIKLLYQEYDYKNKAAR